MHFSNFSKGVFFLVILISLLHSSSLPILADNESYYIQTIKWLNQYGLVKGVSNLHPFLGQFSGWHILQSCFNFNFIIPNLNDINGFLIIGTSFFCLDKWETYQLNRSKNDLYISLLLITNIFLFLFIASPSPDLPIVIIVPIILYFFMETIQKQSASHLKLILVLSLFALLIKVTIAPILILSLILLYQRRSIVDWKFVISISVISLLSFITKNLVITGYPLYPLAFGKQLFNFDWQMNHNVQESYYQLTTMYGWRMNDWQAFIQLSFWQKFMLWIHSPNIYGVMNKLIIFCLAAFPIFFRKRKKVRYLYVYFLLQFVIFYFTSPQYRFYLPVLLSIGLLIASKLLYKRDVLIKGALNFNLFALVFVGFFGLNFKQLTTNAIMQKKEPMLFSQIIFPRENTQFKDMSYNEYKLKNLRYFSPVNDSLYFWQTFDGPLPCVHKNLIDYYSKYYNHIPQLRTGDLKDGFKSVKP